NEFNRFEDNVIGPWFTGGANGNDPDLCSTLNQCAQFRYGILFDQPDANNDQTIFSNNVIVGADVGFDQFANQSAEIVADRLVVDGANVALEVNSQMICRQCDFSNSLTADIQFFDPSYSGTNLAGILDLENFTSEGSHQFLAAAGES